jgi:AbrB family looped-hinge helix DNA binding protein
MTSKGQVTVPADIRRKLALHPGESVQFRVANNGQVLIEKNDWHKDLEKLQKRVAAHLKKHNIPVLSDEELDNAIDQAWAIAAVEGHDG